MTHFYPLTVSDVRKESNNTVSVAFSIPDDVKSKFDYVSGQYLVLKFDVNGEEHRRSYSLSSAPGVDNEYRIAVKKIENGIVSSLINDELKAGDVVNSMPPSGSFIVNPDSSRSKHYVLFAAGSGVTPIISMLKTVVAKEPNSKVTLFYGNRSANETIFKAELDALVEKYPNTLNVVYLYTRENTSDSLLNGRISGGKAKDLVNKFAADSMDKSFYMCGPEDMIHHVTGSLEEMGFSRDNIHFELFTTPTMVVDDNAPVQESDFSGVSKVTLLMDDAETKIDLASDGINILDAAMDAGVDAPFSCKGAVCCTCKCKITKGSATMEMNYALSDAEVEEGFVLACQAHPNSAEITVDFDVI